MRCIAIGACSLLLTGCSAVGGIAGATAAFATGVATANPVIGISVGIAVKAGTDQAVHYVAKRRQRDEHEAIIAAARDLKPGERGRWSHPNLVGSGSDEGEVRVVRAIETPLATCKELLFSVEREGGTPRANWFTTTACRNGDVWQWAAAEPAVERWGNLQ